MWPVRPKYGYECWGPCVRFGFGAKLTQLSWGKPLAFPPCRWGVWGIGYPPKNRVAHVHSPRGLTGGPRFVLGLAPKKVATERGFNLARQPGVTLEGAFDILLVETRVKSSTRKFSYT